MTTDYGLSDLNATSTASDDDLIYILDGTQSKKITVANLLPDVPDASDTAPGNTSTASVGTATTYARGDHDHGVSVPSASSTSPVNTSTAAVGTATTYARGDHDHGITTGGSTVSLSDTAPGNTGTASAGTASSASRSDHDHGVSVPSASDSVSAAGATSASGSSSTYSRGDHSHGGASTLEQLSDVDVSAIDDGQVLTWDATDSEWKPTPRRAGDAQTAFYSINSTYALTIGDNDTAYADGSAASGSDRWASTTALGNTALKLGEDDSKWGILNNVVTYEIRWHRVNEHIRGIELFDSNDNDRTVDEGIYIIFVQASAEVKLKSGFDSSTQDASNHRASIEVHLRQKDADGNALGEVNGSRQYFRAFHAEHQANDESIYFDKAGGMGSGFAFYMPAGRQLEVGFAVARQGAFRERDDGTYGTLVVTDANDFQFNYELALTSLNLIITHIK